MIAQLQRLQVADAVFFSDVTQAINEKLKSDYYFTKVYFRVWLFIKVVAWKFIQIVERTFKLRRSNRINGDYQETVHKSSAYLSGTVESAVWITFNENAQWVPRFFFSYRFLVICTREPLVFSNIH